MDRLENFLQGQIVNKKEELTRRIKNLITQLQYEVVKLEGTKEYCPNGCGIIQYEKDNIDDLCKQINTLKSTLQMYQAIKNEN